MINITTCDAVFSYPRNQNTENSDRYTFVIPKFTLLDEAKIISDLTWKNPVALVQDSKKLFIHAFYLPVLLDKAETLGMQPPVIKEVKDFKKAVTFARKVTQASWGTNPVTITVNTPAL